MLQPVCGKSIESGAIPKKAAEDAAHMAIAVTNGIEYLVTWNCRHIANATMRTQIERVCNSLFARDELAFPLASVFVLA